MRTITEREVHAQRVDVRAALAGYGLPYGIRGSQEYGGPYGYSTAGDVLVNQTADGVDLNQLWDEFTQTVLMATEQRSLLMGLFAADVNQPASLVPQTPTGTVKFEEASEHGEPTSVRSSGEYIEMGYGYRDYDIATRYTWKFLRDADARQVRAIHQSILDADNDLLFTTVFNRLLNNVPGMSPEFRTVYPLWNGDDMKPQPYMSKTFPTPHNHYITTGSTELEATDLEAAMRHVTEHGYGRTPGSQLLVLCNPEDADTISRFRANTADANGTLSSHDFVESEGAPARLTDEMLMGDRPPGSFQGLPVNGSYGPAWVIEHDKIPADYLLVLATSGSDSDLNPIGFRQHANTAYRGLRILPGNNQRYPLVDSFYSRGFGVGTRHRGAASVLQITADAYTAPDLGTAVRP